MANIKAKVVYYYDADEEDELSLAVGDIVTNINQTDGGWWEGELNGKRGVFPENFVEIIKDESIASVPTSIPGSKSPIIKAKATFDYDATEPDELDLKEGDIIEVVNQEDGGWWEGIFNGKKGVFPSNFVEIIPDPSAKDLPTPPQTSVTDELISFEEKPAAAASPLTHPPRPAPIEEETKKTKMPGGMGFAISNADLFKTKLRPVSIADDGKKPMQAVEPMAQNEATALVSKARDGIDGGNIKRNAPAPPADAAEERFKVVFDYVPVNADELGLKKGDIVMITNKDVCDGWWQGTCNGKTGVFPNNFVEAVGVADVAQKEKPPPKKPILPNTSKAPALPSREPSKGLPTQPKKPVLPELKKPAIPELNKPPLPDSHKPVVSEEKKPELKKPPPPTTKAKGVPPRPNEKPSLDESNNYDSIKNKLNATIGSGGRIPSIGKKPLPPQPNGFGRTASFKKPIPVPQRESKPEPEPKPEPTPELKPVSKPAPVKLKPTEPDVSNSPEEQGIEWDAPSNTQVLSNVNKNRIKGPGKALPGKYVQPKEQQNEDVSEPPWKRELAQKQEPKEKGAFPPQKTAASDADKLKAATKESTVVQPVDESIAENLRAELKSTNDQLADMQKKLLRHIEILTNDLDSERKKTASLMIEMDRLQKRVAILEGH